MYATRMSYARSNAHTTLQGKWDENVSWEFYLSDQLPDAALCTAVYCLAVLPHRNEVVLARNHRGWEMLGGHIEPDETIEHALIRECQEEGGFTPESYKLFGYRKITSKQPMPHNQRDGHYPFPTSYIPHFVAVSALPLQAPTGEEIYESKVFPLDELEKVVMEQMPLVKAGLTFYEANREQLS